MKTPHTTNKAFSRGDFEETRELAGDYETCTFDGIDFSGMDLSGCRFSDCTFRSCNLSMVPLAGTVFRETAFEQCKLLGLRFDDCDPFGLNLRFDRCVLNFSSFFGTDLRKTVFTGCTLQETDLTECNLTQAVFDRCDLTRTVFSRTTLVQADFRTATGFSIDPSENYVRKARFSSVNLSGLLDRFDLIIE